MESAVLEGLERSYERKSAHEKLGVSEKLLMGGCCLDQPLRVQARSHNDRADREFCVRHRPPVGAGLPAKRPLKALEHSVFLQEHLSTQAMTLHLFVERTAWQLQLFKHGLDVTLVSGQRRAQALRLKGFLLGRQ